MDFSDKLRRKLEKVKGIDLSQYKLDDSIFNNFLNYALDDEYERNLKTIRQVYELGLNIGNCNLTSRYFARSFNKAKIIYGECPLLKGTRCCSNSSHAWILYNNFYIDTTLKIMVPIEIGKSLGYQEKTTLEPETAKMLSEYLVFDHPFNERARNIEKFNQSLLKIEFEIA